MSERVPVTPAFEKICRRNKENPAPNKDRVRAYRARKSETHKKIKVFIKPEVKDTLVRLCESEGITQSEILERLIQDEARRSIRRKKRSPY